MNATVVNTTVVYPTISLRFGHLTFFSSRKLSEKYSKTD